MPDDRLPRVEVQPLHLTLDGQRRFGILYRAASPLVSEKSIVFVHPFGEEMNKTRRMAALQARALAAIGWTVLQIDLFGCGDSDGDFRDASWDRWVVDVVEAAEWMSARYAKTEWLWGLRVGCLVATGAVMAASMTSNLLFWQPVVSGRQYLTQLLRLRLAADLARADGAKGPDTRELYGQLEGGTTLEVGGYELSPALALGLARAELSPVPAIRRLLWMEMTSSEDACISPAARRCMETWQRAGYEVEMIPVAGQPFWQTQEIVCCMPLIDATVRAVAAAER
jgi:exosortase A-associated hydrolase 2